jgi:hypothetical protein
LSMPLTKPQDVVSKEFGKQHVGVKCGTLRLMLDQEGQERMRLLAYLTSPIRTLERERQQRERDLYAALARGRKRRFERAMQIRR